jgi:mono/diheme cytochrome c family protein
MRTIISVLCLLIGTQAAAQSNSGDAEAGRRLALQRCGTCHVVAADQVRPATDGVPTFAELARDPAMTTSRLRLFLQSPHRPMPDLMLSRPEIDDLTSYFTHLQKH